MRIKRILQEEPKGCVIACLAMVLGRTYASIREEWQNDFSTDGMDTPSFMNYLGDNGFSIIHKAASHYNHKDFAREELLRPFAPVHIICTKPLFDSQHHAMVMDAKGKIYDPAGRTEDEVKTDYAVVECIGLFK